jgi:hypothetical protein
LWFNPGWQWGNGTLDNEPARIYASLPGLHTLNLWMREDGMSIDRLNLK